MHFPRCIWNCSSRTLQLSRQSGLKMAATFAVRSLDHLVLTVRSIPETVAFYTTHLGMRHEVFTSPANPAIQRWIEPYISIIQVWSAHTDRNALLFGDQKINLHQAGKEFEPKAKKVMPGSADLCFLTDTQVETVLQAFQAARIEVLVAKRIRLIVLMIFRYWRELRSWRGLVPSASSGVSMSGIQMATWLSEHYLHPTLYTWIWY